MTSFVDTLRKDSLTFHNKTARERCHLQQERDDLVRYTESLKQLRQTMYQSYHETKGWKFPWTRYELMSGMIIHVLEAYEKIKQAKLKEERDETLEKLGIVQKTTTTESSAMPYQDEYSSSLSKEISTRNQESDIERMRIENAKLQEVYRQECEIFKTLQREFRSLRKYGMIQRYIIVKLLIKIAGKSDV